MYDTQRQPSLIKVYHIPPQVLPGAIAQSWHPPSLSTHTALVRRIAGQVLLVSKFIVLASPVPSPIVDIAQYERRTDFSFANSQLSKREIEVDVLVIGGAGKNEHWYLKIGPILFQAGARDFATMDATKSKLTTSSYNWDEVESQLGGDYYILPLGKATYKDADDQDEAFAKIREIRMKKAAAKKGAAYKQEYDDNYTRVSKAVWGVDLQP
ncbi:hypothetical protein F5877DRAFT_72336 [Lentinula edodes]|nr:hypothetical protein F5877DRAFT_72336 [Lentinula edodes]